MKAVVKITLCVIALLSAPLVGAAVYKYVDENGNVAYSDKPVEGSEKFKIRGSKSSPSSSQSEVATQGGDDDSGDKPQATNYSSLLVLTPGEGKVIDPATGTVQVIMLPTPTLGETDELVINIDGKDVNQGREVNLSVSNLPSGNHTVSGRIVNKVGKVVIESPMVSFTIGDATLRAESEQ